METNGYGFVQQKAPCAIVALALCAGAAVNRLNGSSAQAHSTRQSQNRISIGRRTCPGAGSPPPAPPFLPPPRASVRGPAILGRRRHRPGPAHWPQSPPSAPRPLSHGNRRPRHPSSRLRGVAGRTKQNRSIIERRSCLAFLVWSLNDELVSRIEAVRSVGLGGVFNVRCRGERWRCGSRSECYVAWQRRAEGWLTDSTRHRIKGGRSSGNKSRESAALFIKVAAIALITSFPNSLHMAVINNCPRHARPDRITSSGVGRRMPRPCSSLPTPRQVNSQMWFSCSDCHAVNMRRGYYLIRGLRFSLSFPADLVRTFRPRRGRFVSDTSEDRY